MFSLFISTTAPNMPLSPDTHLYKFKIQGPEILDSSDSKLRLKDLFSWLQDTSDPVEHQLSFNRSAKNVGFEVDKLLQQLSTFLVQFQSQTHEETHYLG